MAEPSVGPRPAHAPAWPVLRGAIGVLPQEASREALENRWRVSSEAAAVEKREPMGVSQMLPFSFRPRIFISSPCLLRAGGWFSLTSHHHRPGALQVLLAKVAVCQPRAGADLGHGPALQAIPAGGIAAGPGRLPTRARRTGGSRREGFQLHSVVGFF